MPLSEQGRPVIPPLPDTREGRIVCVTLETVELSLSQVWQPILPFTAFPHAADTSCGRNLQASGWGMTDAEVLLWDAQFSKEAASRSSTVGGDGANSQQYDSVVCGCVAIDKLRSMS